MDTGNENLGEKGISKQSDLRTTRDSCSGLMNNGEKAQVTWSGLGRYFFKISFIHMCI
jgi:hypothetical protein